MLFGRKKKIGKNDADGSSRAELTPMSPASALDAINRAMEPKANASEVKKRNLFRRAEKREKAADAADAANLTKKRRKKLRTVMAVTCSCIAAAICAVIGAAAYSSHLLHAAPKTIRSNVGFYCDADSVGIVITLNGDVIGRDSTIGYTGEYMAALFEPTAAAAVVNGEVILTRDGAVTHVAAARPGEMKDYISSGGKWIPSWQIARSLRLSADGSALFFDTVGNELKYVSTEMPEDGTQLRATTVYGPVDWSEASVYGMNYIVAVDGSGAAFTDAGGMLHLWQTDGTDTVILQDLEPLMLSADCRYLWCLRKGESADDMPGYEFVLVRHKKSGFTAHTLPVRVSSSGYVYFDSEGEEAIYRSCDGDSVRLFTARGLKDHIISEAGSGFVYPFGNEFISACSREHKAGFFTVLLPFSDLRSVVWYRSGGTTEGQQLFILSPFRFPIPVPDGNITGCISFTPDREYMLYLKGDFLIKRRTGLFTREKTVFTVPDDNTGKPAEWRPALSGGVFDSAGKYFYLSAPDGALCRIDTEAADAEPEKIWDGYGANIRAFGNSGCIFSAAPSVLSVNIYGDDRVVVPLYYSDGSDFSLINGNVLNFSVEGPADAPWLVFSHYELVSYAMDKGAINYVMMPAAVTYIAKDGLNPKKIAVSGYSGREIIINRVPSF